MEFVYNCGSFNAFMIIYIYMYIYVYIYMIKISGKWIHQILIISLVVIFNSLFTEF